MQRFLGEFECKVDDKGRLRLPSQLIKQLDDKEKRLVINRGFEQCLVLYPHTAWEKIAQEVNALNMYVKKNRDFARYFYRGATELEMDNSDRINLPNRLLEYANIQKDIIVFAYYNRIELWAKDTYDTMLNNEPSDFANLAEDVMGGSKTHTHDQE
jgi:MraZ protein